MMASDDFLEQLETSMFDDFQRLSKAEQTRKIMLAGNAEYILRMTQNYERETLVGKAVWTLLEALMRYVRPV